MKQRNWRKILSNWSIGKLAPPVAEYDRDAESKQLMLWAENTVKDNIQAFAEELRLDVPSCGVEGGRRIKIAMESDDVVLRIDLAATICEYYSRMSQGDRVWALSRAAKFFDRVAKEIRMAGGE